MPKTKALLDIDPTALFICAFENRLFTAHSLSARFLTFSGMFSTGFPVWIAPCFAALPKVFPAAADACKRLAARRWGPLHSPFTNRGVGVLNQWI
ncbi:hypothetical protein P3T43_002119 [Paraburkholderia sp. GAS41]|uniref:hypothetical protein n=1 Tax=Paraburkholderia sp. GAS41 TaxID=3035134 RepID=UPI003D2080A6